MKNYILIITLIISACNCKKINNSNPSKLSTSVSVIDDKAFKVKNLKEFGNDTMKFIQNLEKNKAHYVNKPLSILLNDLDLPVKGYLPGTVYENLNISPSLTLLFYEPNTMDNKIRNNQRYDISVKWSIPIKKEDIFKLSNKNNRKWTKEEADYFGQFVITDVIAPK